MIEQIALFASMAVVIVFGLALAIWRERKKHEYKNDERWQTIQNKANSITGYLKHVLAVSLGVVAFIVAFTDPNLYLSFVRVMIIAMLIIGFRDGIELFALLYFNRRL